MKDSKDIIASDFSCLDKMHDLNSTVEPTLESLSKKIVLYNENGLHPANLKLAGKTYSLICGHRIIALPKQIQLNGTITCYAMQAKLGVQ